jgi:hypothetical protein
MEFDDFQDMVDDKKSGLESILLRYSQAMLVSSTSSRPAIGRIRWTGGVRDGF